MHYIITPPSSAFELDEAELKRRVTSSGCPGTLDPCRSHDGTVKIWNSSTKGIRTLRGHTSWVMSVAFCPDGDSIASPSLDGTVKLWQMPLVPEARGPGTGTPVPSARGEA